MYGLLIKIRNYAYDKGIIKQKKLPLPVISVGNLSVGGSGKTSTVRFIAEHLSSDNRICILLRGYKRKSKGPLIVSRWGKIEANIEEGGDEASMLAKLLPDTSVVVAENRYEGGMYAVKELDPDIFILDDGFQHRSLHRDLDIVLLRKRDIKDRPIPFGRLREPFSSLSRADALILSYQEIEPFEININKPVFKMYRYFKRLYNPIKGFGNIDEGMLGIEWIAFSGLGDNDQFFVTLEKLGFNLTEKISFRDHYDYKNFRPRSGNMYITTMKDIFKLEPSENIYALDVEVKIEGLIEFIKNKLSRLFIIR